MVTLRTRTKKAAAQPAAPTKKKSPATKAKKTAPKQKKDAVAKKKAPSSNGSSQNSSANAVLNEFLITRAADHKSKHKDISTLHTLITKIAPSLKPELQGKSTLAYGGFDYETKSKCHGRWARMGIMVNKTGLSLMVSGETKDGKYLLEQYDKKHFGKASVGKSCIRFSKLDDLDMENVKKLIAEAKDANVSSIAV